MRKVPVVLLALVAVSVALLAATAQAKPKAAKVTTISLSGWSAGADEDNLLQQVVNTFEQSHPSIKVNYSVINGDYTTAMTARFAARNAPDVFYVDSSVAPSWVQQGVLEPLDTYIKSSKYNTKPFFPSLLNTFKVGAKTYGFPKDWSPLAMEVNTAMLSQAHAKAPKTWAQLTATAQALNTSGVLNGGKPICLSPSWDRMLPFIFQNKGSLANVQSPAVASAVSFYVGLINKGLATTPDKLGAGWCGEALGKQKAAIAFEGNWVLPFMKTTYPTVRYGVFPMVKNKTGGNLAFTVSYSIAKDSPNKHAAWTLLSWLTGPVGMKLWVSKGLALPSRTDVKAIGGRGAFLAAAPWSHGWGFPNFTNTNTVMGNDLTAVINGSKTIPQMLADVDQALKG
jgi:multiple sugar transport system substrate-binding protein